MESPPLSIKMLASMIDLKRLGELSGAPVLHVPECLDLISFCTSAQLHWVAPFFDVEFYMAHSPGAGDYPGGPFRHFVTLGARDLRSPHLLIDFDYMAQACPELFGEEFGFEQFHACLAGNLIDPSPFFSITYYLDQSAPPPAGSALLDFLASGAAAGRRACQLFDPEYYIAQNDDVPHDKLAALLHFITVGDRALRRPAADTDPAFYHSAEHDIAFAGIGPVEHALRYGRMAKSRFALTAAGPGETSHLKGSRWMAMAGPRPIHAAGWQRASARLDGDLQQRLREATAAFPEHDALPYREINHTEILAQLRFAPHVAPQLDILIACHDEYELTVECLHAIASNGSALAFRVTLVDDASPDPRIRLLAQIPGLRYRRNLQNLHFLRSCNEAFPECDAPFLLLLNNDTQVTPGAIDRLYEAVAANPGVAAAGARLLYPNGRLQEAGCTVRPDGTTKLVGVGSDPSLPSFNYGRELNYVSGACLMLHREALGGELFDSRYAPAYCEDTDLCLRLRAAGHRILYVPEATVVHHMSASTGKVDRQERLQLIACNQEALARKWEDLLTEQAKVRVLAFYLPQFHTTPQNDLWWGKGFTEWTNVVRSTPCFVGHAQPHLPADLGFYDLSQPAAMGRQQEMACRYGIEGFAVYYYRFGHERLLQNPLENLLAVPEIDFRFCLCWANENWTRTWDGGDRKVLIEQSYDNALLDMVCADAVRHARDRRAILVGGKPLFLLYRPMLLPDPRMLAEKLRQAFRADGWPDAHLVYIESMETAANAVSPHSIGFDASVEFPPHGIGKRRLHGPEITKPGWVGHIFDYEATVIEACTRPAVAYPRYPCVFPSWDNTPRQPLRSTSFPDASPELFERYVEFKVRALKELFVGDRQLLFVNAWNEWAEGAHLEPDQIHGHAWLNALSNGVAAATWPGTLY